MKTLILGKWSIYMLAIEKIVAVEAKFDAPRIGMCANVIDMTRS